MQATTDTPNLQAAKSPNHNFVRLGDFAALRETFPFTPMGPEPDPLHWARGKMFLGDALESKSFEMSVHRLLPGQGIPFLHRHKNNEELYVIIQGQGRFLLDGEELPVREGDVLRVDPAAVRAWAATNDSALVYLCIQIHQGSLQTKTREDGERVAGDLPWA